MVPVGAIESKAPLRMPFSGDAFAHDHSSILRYGATPVGVRFRTAGNKRPFFRQINRCKITQPVANRLEARLGSLCRFGAENHSAAQTISSASARPVTPNRWRRLAFASAPVVRSRGNFDTSTTVIHHAPQQRDQLVSVPRRSS